ncbi:type IIL restriction-modification enzyme MmeI [Polaromonas sp.]|uniref:type IIL restriction-modification enzyme MmeI n=1 Tax=Polaromonas sp. TaxID=1869339 RepID=UPI0013BD72A7|nr:type IIL restriction-modification enzyme MmeI [Polaromonas sp.]NDP64518.1 class I SAM-dependent DNA methyltransferase [Polaromonas sp.]
MCFRDAKAAGVMDFVTAWYCKASDYIAESDIRAAFVSTNSITQGEQIGILWRALLSRRMLHIHFAHRTFRWTNEASGKASVYCVIIGFGVHEKSGKVIFDYETVDSEPHAIPATEINPYLIDAPVTLLANQSRNLFGAPEMMYGSKPTDGGHFLMTDEEKQSFLAAQPGAEKFVKPFIGAHEYLHNEKRWVLWLVDASPKDLQQLPKVMARVHAVDQFRKASKAESTRAYPYPTLFRQVTQPKSDYILIPGHSSENRAFIPFGFFSKDVIFGDSCFSLPDATLFHFGVIQSTMHMAWVRYTCGRIKSDYRYSKDIVYNNFPWPDLSSNQPSPQAGRAQAAIEIAAQAVLDARALFPESSLADLYDPLTMPPVLVKAHQKLDAAVDAAYALGGGKKTWKNDAERVAFLFELYQRYTSLLPAEKAKSKPKRSAKVSSVIPAQAGI